MLDYLNGKIIPVPTNQIPKNHNFLLYDCEEGTVRDERKTTIFQYTGSKNPSAIGYQQIRLYEPPISRSYRTRPIGRPSGTLFEIF